MLKRMVRSSLLALAMLAVPAFSFAGVLISVNIAPPALPVYVQPPCPGDGYIWTPGYWAYGPDGYYWVPGTWVMAPEPGLLWTPGYWGWNGGVYIWHAGYWGPHVGFYGGINYGFGYTGVGYAGGYWHGGHFFYNRYVNHITVTNVHIYNRVVVNEHVTRVSFNGGRGGIMRRPTREDERFEHERHFEPTRMQMDHEHGARQNREFLASVNHGRPALAATPRPGEFRGHDFAPRPINRPMGHDMGRPVARPQNSPRSMERRDPSARNMNRGYAPRPESRPGERAAAYHPGNGGGHESRPQHENAPRGHENGHGPHH
jgi:hypothetical protein